MPRRSQTAGRVHAIKCVIFDLDGVLFSGTNQGYLDCHDHALRSVGLIVPPAEQRRRLLQCWSHPHEYQLRLFIDDPGQLAAACHAYEEYLLSARFANHIGEVPGATRTVRELAASGVQLAIASGMHDRQIPLALEKIGLDTDLFDETLSAYQLPDDTVQKPHPYMLQHILGALGRCPSDAAYVGDSRVDVRMARAAGVFAVAVLTGNMSRDDAVEERADAVLESVDRLADLLNGREPTA
jgi:phosphoglycolate phosphatase